MMKRFLKRTWKWIDDRSGLTGIIKPLFDHLVPPGISWAYVFGSATLFCFILQLVTGVALALLYQPSSAEAYQSLQYINENVFLGKQLRGLHYFGASGMMLMVGIHMSRVYITASYKYPREMQWLTGVVLLLLTVSMGFTGQLLRWDDNGVWSAVVAAEQMGRIPLIGKSLAHLLIGGENIGGQSLSRFFAYHVFLFPAMIFVFIAFHLMLVVRNGISEPPKAGRPVDPATYRKWYQDLLREKGIPFWPYVAWRDVVFGTAVILGVVALSLVVGPPALSKPPDPSIVNTAPKPDWYLLWIYALFALMPPAIESYAMFLTPIIVLGLLFSLPFLSKKGERSPIRRPWAIAGVITVFTTVIALLVVGNKASWSPDFATRRLSSGTIGSRERLVTDGALLFYNKGCQYCHKIAGNGGNTGPDLTYVAGRLTDNEIRLKIVNGGNNMPSYGQSLTGVELYRLISFLQTRK